MPSQITSRLFEIFFSQYVETALWSSSDRLPPDHDAYDEEDDCVPLDSWADIDDIAPETLASMREDCQAFYDEHFDDISDDVGQAGHDFWLTRNHHGAGFWDGDWPEGIDDKLTEASHAYGNCDLYVGDDGKIYS